MPKACLVRYIRYRRHIWHLWNMHQNTHDRLVHGCRILANSRSDWPKWDKSGIFFQIRFSTLKWVRIAPSPGIFFRYDSVHFRSVSQNVLNLIWKKSPDLSHFGSIWPTLGPNLVTQVRTYVMRGVSDLSLSRSAQFVKSLFSFKIEKYVRWWIH